MCRGEGVGFAKHGSSLALLLSIYHIAGAWHIAKGLTLSAFVLVLGLVIVKRRGVETVRRKRARRRACDCDWERMVSEVGFWVGS